MKKLTVILLAFAILVLPSCKCTSNNTSKSAEGQNSEINEKERMVTEELKVNLQSLVESTKQMKPAIIFKNVNGSLQLSDKEKMVKPDYFVDPASVNALVTLSQKYRAAAMLTVDKAVAKLYDMPVDEIEAAQAKIAVDVNDAALKEFSEDIYSGKDHGEVISKFCEAEFDSERSNLCWEAVAAGLVEQIFILTRNMDKFLPMFDDQAAADVTYNFVCVHDGITKMMEFYPEMESLNSALLPLYVINAVSVDQLRDQLLELKGEIEVVRAFLLQ